MFATMSRSFPSQVTPGWTFAMRSIIASIVFCASETATGSSSSSSACCIKTRACGNDPVSSATRDTLNSSVSGPYRDNHTRAITRLDDIPQCLSSLAPQNPPLSGFDVCVAGEEVLPAQPLDGKVAKVEHLDAQGYHRAGLLGRRTCALGGDRRLVVGLLGLFGGTSAAFAVDGELRSFFGEALDVLIDGPDDKVTSGRRQC